LTSNNHAVLCTERNDHSPKLKRNRCRGRWTFSDNVRYHRYFYSHALVICSDATNVL